MAGGSRRQISANAQNRKNRADISTTARRHDCGEDAPHAPRRIHNRRHRPRRPLFVANGVQAHEGLFCLTNRSAGRREWATLHAKFTTMKKDTKCDKQSSWLHRMVRLSDLFLSFFDFVLAINQTAGKL